MSLPRLLLAPPPLEAEAELDVTPVRGDATFLECLDLDLDRDLEDLLGGYLDLDWDLWRLACWA